MFLLLSFFLSFTSCQSPASTEKAPNKGETTSDHTGFDQALAEKYGADEYGMKKYVMAFLKKGPNRELDSLKATELQAAHMANIGRMAEAGKLVLAGPFLGDGDLRGIYIFDVPSIEEAKALTESDPAIQAGSLVMELKEWYGSAAVTGINEVHPKLSKTPM
ncbi:MAG: YciI family protein [Bacteroidota bacterium]